MPANGLTLPAQHCFCAGRRALVEQLLGRLGDDPLTHEVLRHTFWSAAWCNGSGTPTFIFPFPYGPLFRFETIGFGPAPAGIQRIPPRHLRLPVTTNWFLDLAAQAAPDDYLAALSAKTRKQYRWLRNAYQREGVSIAPARTAADLAAFLDIYAQQRPDSRWLAKWRPGFLRLYAEFEKMGANASLLMRDREGRPVAGAMAYLTEAAINLHLLARWPGRLDKLSPGNYLVFDLINRALAGKTRPGLFLGPGEYDYKKMFLGQPLPVYRYEVLSVRNLAGLVKLYHRAWKNRRAAQAAAEAAVD